jgi:hypothetical protein
MSPPPRPGLPLPPGVIQPFFLRFDPDDWHVMAVLDGHPAYEAVEAMARARAGGGWAVRAIITRHNGVQIDHINDPALLAAMAGADRHVAATDIAFAIEERESSTRAHLAFVSTAGETIELQVVALGRPDPRGAGLSDPGAHSADASLPLMWRHASALAAAGTHTLIDGRRYEAPVRILRPGVEAREGYVTAGHSLGVIRAGQVVMKPLAAPAALAPGGEWRFAIDGVDTTFQILERAAAGELLIERLGTLRERIFARNDGERLILRSIEVPDPDGLVLTFGDGRFEIGAASQTALVAGCFEASDRTVVLRPEAPAWAATRPVRVDMAQAGDETRITTTIGGEAARPRPAQRRGGPA